MTIDIKLIEQPFTDEFIAEFLKITKLVFPNEKVEWYNSREWRLKNMPNFTCFFAYEGFNIIGYKIGYAIAHNIFYSWLGGTSPEYRNKGVASELMRLQHQQASKNKFDIVETHVEQHNKKMIAFNLKHGLSIIGMYIDDSNPYFIMRKKIEK